MRFLFCAGLSHLNLWEIGVFKGDNAVRIIRLAQRFKTNISYIGFDLFENKDEFFKLHPEDRAVYDTPEHPHWEFQSGQHALMKVQSKISSVLSQDNFALITGDSTITLPAHRKHLTDASIIFIDGCHDYDIVSQRLLAHGRKSGHGGGLR